MSASNAAKEAAWLEKLLLNLNKSNDTPPTLFCDNQGAIDLIHNHKFHLKAKHIDIRCNFIRNDIIEAKRLKIIHILGKEQLANMLTKQLPIDQFKAILRVFEVREAGRHR
jgi:hypothetical protein